MREIKWQGGKERKKGDIEKMKIEKERERAGSR